MVSHKGNPILTEDEVIDIKNSLECGITVATLSKVYGVSCTSIVRIRDGVSWKDINMKE